MNELEGFVTALALAAIFGSIIAKLNKLDPLIGILLGSCGILPPIILSFAGINNPLPQLITTMISLGLAGRFLKIPPRINGVIFIASYASLGLGQMLIG